MAIALLQAMQEALPTAVVHTVQHAMSAITAVHAATILASFRVAAVLPQAVAATKAIHALRTDHQTATTVLITTTAHIAALVRQAAIVAAAVMVVVAAAAATVAEVVAAATVVEVAQAAVKPRFTP